MLGILKLGHCDGPVKDFGQGDSKVRFTPPMEDLPNPYCSPLGKNTQPPSTDVTKSCGYGWPVAANGKTCPAQGIIDNDVCWLKPLPSDAWTPLGKDSVECPKGECEYQINTVTCGQWMQGKGFGRQFRTNKATSVFANKTKWDSTYEVPCCLREFYDPNDKAKLGSHTLLCDPHWNDDHCADLLKATCSTIVQDKDGDPVSLIGSVSHPCNNWYTRVLKGPPPKSYNSNAAVAITETIEEVCTKNPDLKECSCYNQNFCTENCTAYQACASCPDPQACKVQVSRSVDGSPLNVAQPLCLNKGSCAGKADQLITSQMQEIMDSCPDVCYQVLENVCTNVSTLTDAEKYTAFNQEKECAIPSVPSTSGRLAMDTTLLVPLTVNEDGLTNWSELAVVPLLIENVAPMTAETLKVDITVPDQIEGIEVQIDQAGDSVSIAPQQQVAVSFSVPPNSPIPNLKPGEVRNMTVKVHDSATGKMLGSTIVSLQGSSGKFSPTPSPCGESGCPPSGVRTIVRVEPSVWAWLLVLVGAVVLALSGVTLFQSWNVDRVPGSVASSTGPVR